jgi:hypothetical protein
MRRLPAEAQGFVDWLATPEAQLVLRRSGMVGTEAAPIPWAEQGERLAAAIRASGPEVPLRELQRLVRVLGPFTRLSTTFRFEEGLRLDAVSRGLVLRLAHEVAEGRYAGRTLILAGFSDGRGAAEANRRLSVDRAEAVEAALLEALGGALPEGMRLRSTPLARRCPWDATTRARGLGGQRSTGAWSYGCRGRSSAPCRCAASPRDTWGQRKGRSEQPLGAEAELALAADDEVVVEDEAQGPGRRPRSGRSCLCRHGTAWVARGVVVDEDQGEALSSSARLTTSRG